MFVMGDGSYRHFNEAEAKLQLIGSESHLPLC